VVVMYYKSILYGETRPEYDDRQTDTQTDLA